MAVKTSAGLLMYRTRGGEPEVLLVHPGGPFWQNKDIGTWSLPKGEQDDHENDFLDVARREFEEETGFRAEGPFTSLGTVKRKDGKVVHAWAFEGDCDPSKLVSNTIFIDWPPRSGKKLEIPEVDKAEFFSLSQARLKLNPYQVPFIDTFEDALKAL
jgi:predicted NUDIX family NTP pyrophosphohydrolase